MDDVIAKIADKADCPASLGEVLMAVALDPNSRFQVDHLATSPSKMITRAVQGHSGKLYGQVRDDVAFERVISESQVYMCNHGTTSELLLYITGLGRPGLIPRGRA